MNVAIASFGYGKPMVNREVADLPSDQEPSQQ